jgi:dolichol-phosphate mannosyltransferase
LFAQIAQFLVVGASGLVVNLAVLTVALAFGASMRVAVIIAIALSIVWNFLLNRRFSFSYARHRAPLRQFFSFLSATSLGAVVNYMVTLSVLPLVGIPQVAAIVGVVTATTLNFVASRYWVFKVKHVAPKTDAAEQGTVGSSPTDR